MSAPDHHGGHPPQQDSRPPSGSTPDQEQQAAHEHAHRLAALEERLLPLIEAAERAGQSATAAAAHQASKGAERIVPAWRRATAGELRWPVSAVVVAMIAMQLAVPHRLSLTRWWLIPALEAVLLAVLVVSNPVRMTSRSPLLRGLGLTLIALASIANGYSALALVLGLIRGTEGEDAASLLVVGGTIWLTNIIVFGLWYWELDRGGPAARALALRSRPSFLFPEMTAPELAGPEWEPQFVDYLYLSYTNATAFSPTDTLPFSRWSRLTMMTQSTISLATGALVIARAVNILK